MGLRNSAAPFLVRGCTLSVPALSSAIMLRRIVLIALVAGLALLALVDATPYAQGAARTTASASLDEKLSRPSLAGTCPALSPSPPRATASCIRERSAKRMSQAGVR